MSELQIFNNKDFGKIRTVVLDEEAWFVGKDIASALGYSNPRDAIGNHVDSEDRVVAKIDTRGGAQNVTIINESGLYSLILGSKLPKAKEFKRWITREVLPTIRKTGGYVNNDEMFINNYLPYADEATKELFKTTLSTVRNQNKIIAEQKGQIKKLTPKADFFDAVTNSKTAIPMSIVAKILDMGIGRNKIFALLREEKVLMNNNVPYQEFVDKGYFRVIETKYTLPDGGEVISVKTLVYQKGVDFIRKIIKRRDFV